MIGEALSNGLVLPALCLAALGWFVPRVFARVWPEGVAWLMALGLVSTIVMVFVAAGLFAVVYAAQGVVLSDLLETGGASVPVHFVKLGLASALLWAPLLVLSLAGVPKRWMREVW